MSTGAYPTLAMFVPRVCLMQWFVYRSLHPAAALSFGIKESMDFVPSGLFTYQVVELLCICLSLFAFWKKDVWRGSSLDRYNSIAEYRCTPSSLSSVISISLFEGRSW